MNVGAWVSERIKMERPCGSDTADSDGNQRKTIG